MVSLLSHIQEIAGSHVILFIILRLTRSRRLETLAARNFASFWAQFNSCDVVRHANPVLFISPLLPLQMGCIQSKAEDKHYDDGYGDWNKAYAADMEASKSSIAAGCGRTHRSISGQTEEMNIKKTGVNLDKVNGYAVSKTLGKGAYGEVFLATKGGEKFALKVLKQW